MNVEIINVGTELLLGEIVNTNAAVILKMCRDLGFNVYYQCVVGDNPKRLYDCIDMAFRRGADCVMTTGGLGPTTDDLTKDISAQYLGLELVYNEVEALKVKEKCEFITGSTNLPDNNYHQAYFPKDAYILENKMGTANGCVMCKDGYMIINLPGPPKELAYVLEYSLKPYLLRYQTDTLFTHDYNTMFISESQLDELLADLINEQDDLSIALYAGDETVRIRLGVKAKDRIDAMDRMQKVQKEIEERLGDYIVKDDLKEAFSSLNCTIGFKGDILRVEPYFVMSDDPDIVVDVKVRREELGEVVEIMINDEQLLIPCFGCASDFYHKIEARFIARLYKYVMNHL